MVLQILSPVLIAAGLSLPEGGSVGWLDHLLWSLFAAVAALVQLITLSNSASSSAAQRWSLAAVATAALVGYWVIIVLPGISANSAFLQTLGVGCAAVGLWLAPGRRI
ncbi:MAG TPA: hypothetical protein VK063_06020 [Beutenbergiaceae bacterium]|nr:hypothetical protein [Beutenbergiaceae bacterium]